MIGEEIFDSLQRQMMDDPELQPMVQRLMRIHVTEEARHIQFARDGVRKRVTEMPRISRFWVANINGLGGVFFRYLFTNPVPYNRAGLDGRQSTTRRPRQPELSRGSADGIRTVGRVPAGGRPDGADRPATVEAHEVPVIASR